MGKAASHLAGNQRTMGALPTVSSESPKSLDLGFSPADSQHADPRQLRRGVEARKLQISARRTAAGRRVTVQRNLYGIDPV